MRSPQNILGQLFQGKSNIPKITKTIIIKDHSNHCSVNV
jgi:hypothetical protein